MSKQRRSVIDEWIPWPDLDGSPSSSTSNQKSTEPLRNAGPPSTLGYQHRSSSTPPSKDASNRRRESIGSPLDGLSQESSDKCRRIHDMGFPLDRLARACKVLGNDDQKLINYCLFVDKLVEDSTMASAQKSVSNYGRVVEEAAFRHSMDEEKTRKHLKAFCRLAEFGFEPPSKVHDALIKCDLDYEKAFEQMLE